MLLSWGVFSFKCNTLWLKYVLYQSTIYLQNGCFKINIGVCIPVRNTSDTGESNIYKREHWWTLDSISKLQIVLQLNLIRCVSYGLMNQCKLFAKYFHQCEIVNSDNVNNSNIGAISTMVYDHQLSMYIHHPLNLSVKTLSFN